MWEAYLSTPNRPPTYEIFVLKEIQRLFRIKLDELCQMSQSIHAQSKTLRSSVARRISRSDNRACWSRRAAIGFLLSEISEQLSVLHPVPYENLSAFDWSRDIGDDNAGVTILTVPEGVMDKMKNVSIQ